MLYTVAMAVSMCFALNANDNFTKQSEVLFLRHYNLPQSKSICYGYAGDQKDSF